jgi:protein-L-isoaspartate O-methyltransferase
VSTPIGYFEDMYARNPDPWSFETRWYEERKHALTVDALAQRRYRSAFEPGCSTGMLTSLLAARCDHLLAVDAIEACTAAKRVADRPHVTVRPPDAAGLATAPAPGPTDAPRTASPHTWWLWPPSAERTAPS